jgi:prevent-host-death family protein
MSDGVGVVAPDPVAAERSRPAMPVVSALGSPLATRRWTFVPPLSGSVVWSGSLPSQGVRGERDVGRTRVRGVVNVTEAKAQLSRLVDEAAAGGRVVIGKAGRPMAVLVAFEEDPSPRRLGGWRGRVRIAEDFDDPLPEDLLRRFGSGHA